MACTCRGLKPWQPKLSPGDIWKSIEFNLSRAMEAVFVCVRVVLTDSLLCKFLPQSTFMKYASFNICNNGQGSSLGYLVGTATDRVVLRTKLGGHGGRLTSAVSRPQHKCHSIGPDTNTQSLVRHLMSGPSCFAQVSSPKTDRYRGLPPNLQTPLLSRAQVENIRSSSRSLHSAFP